MFPERKSSQFRSQFGSLFRLPVPVASAGASAQEDSLKTKKPDENSPGFDILKAYP